jgi:type II secretory pathway pseudopilin PulG
MRHFLTRRSDGFILIEAFAAFAILTLVLAALMTGLFGAVRNDDRASFMTQAVRAARSQFAALGVSTPAAPGVSSGWTEDGLAYVLTIRLVATPAPVNPQTPHLQAFWAHIDLTRAQDATGKGATLRFDAFKIVPPGVEAPR